MYIGAWSYTLTLKQNKILGTQQPTGENAGQKVSKSITTLIQQHINAVLKRKKTTSLVLNNGQFQCYSIFVDSLLGNCRIGL